MTFAGPIGAHFLLTCSDFASISLIFDTPRPSSRAVLEGNERPFGIHRAGDELQMAVIARQAEIANPGHAIPVLHRRVGPLDARAHTGGDLVHPLLPIRLLLAPLGLVGDPVLDASKRQFIDRKSTRLNSSHGSISY